RCTCCWRSAGSRPAPRPACTPRAPARPKRARRRGRRRGFWAFGKATVAPMSGQGSPAELLAPFLAHPERAGVLCDFDGTLSPIVPDPATARPVAGALDALGALADRYAVVAVVSGRP